MKLVELKTELYLLSLWLSSKRYPDHLTTLLSSKPCTQWNFRRSRLPTLRIPWHMSGPVVTLPRGPSPSPQFGTLYMK